MVAFYRALADAPDQVCVYAYTCTYIRTHVCIIIYVYVLPSPRRCSRSGVCVCIRTHVCIIIYVYIQSARVLMCMLSPLVPVYVNSCLTYKHASVYMLHRHVALTCCICTCCICIQSASALMNIQRFTKGVCRPHAHTHPHPHAHTPVQIHTHAHVHTHQDAGALAEDSDQ